MNAHVDGSADLAPARALTIIAAIYGVSLVLTAALARAAGAPFALWFRDTPLLLAALLGFVLLLGVIWDGSLVSIGLVSEKFRGWRTPGASGLSVESLRARRFFTCGASPILMLLATGFVILGTSNLTLLNLQLLGSVTQWRDPFFWQLEGALLEKIIQSPIATTAWDGLYHSAWGIELLAAFALIVVGRGPRIVLHYCVTMILLFYVGRLLGILNPVMGPAFYRPDLFAWLDGSVTSEAMRRVTEVLAASPEKAVDSGGILLGGVSARPSLHVAMVAVTAYWLAVARRWTVAITLPWVALVWTSTVVLGWHYILDGAGGIILGAVCVLLARWLLEITGASLGNVRR